MSDLVGNPKDRFSRDAAQSISDYNFAIHGQDGIDLITDIKASIMSTL